MTRNRKPYLKACEHCGRTVPMRREQRFCSKSCSATSTTLARGIGSYYGVHNRVKSERGSAAGHTCVDCGRPAEEWSYDGLDPDELTTPEGYRFSVRPEHYVARCRRCHARLDRSGERNHRARHTDAQVAAIVAEYRAGLITQTALAAKYGVSQSAISDWVRGVHRRP